VRRPVPLHPGNGTIVIVPGYGFYPWAYGGLGFGAYYGDYSDGFYDWWNPIGGGYAAQSPDDDGGLRLKVTPREASVYVDGYYVGLVDDFDGVFQKLRLEAGPHRIDIQLEGREPLVFDVNIEPHHTVTYHGTLRTGP